jgi:WD40 repeat protein
VTGGWDKTVRLWETSSGSLHHTCEGHGGDVWAVAFSATTPFAASVGEDRIVRVWQNEKREQVASLVAHTGSLCSVAFTRDGQYLATAGHDGTSRVRDMKQVAR